MDWDEAVEEAKDHLGITGYCSDWDEVVELAKEILEDERQQEYEDFCYNAQCDYREYLKSPRWEKLRMQAFEKYGSVRKDCGLKENDFRNPLQVHHLHYNFLYCPNEIEALVVVCKNCHRARHKLKVIKPPEKIETDFIDTNLEMWVNK